MVGQGAPGQALQQGAPGQALQAQHGVARHEAHAGLEPRVGRVQPQPEVTEGRQSGGFG